jgi:hypothetical protein
MVEEKKAVKQGSNGDNHLTIFASLLIAIASIVCMSAEALARRAIPDDNLAYPVLVTLTTAKVTSAGSGFYLNTEDAIYLVTARHVLAVGLDPDPETKQVPDAELSLLSYSKDLPVAKRNVMVANFVALRASGDVKFDQVQDVAVVRIATSHGAQSTFLPGVIRRELGGGGILGVAVAAIKLFDQVLVGNDALIYGYPTSLGLKQSPQFDPTRPLLRKGLVAGQDFDKRSIIIDGPAYHGNSGGPVFQIETEGGTTSYNLIGVVTELVPLVEATPDLVFVLNSGYSVVKPMDFVLELVKPVSQGKR